MFAGKQSRGWASGCLSEVCWKHARRAVSQTVAAGGVCSRGSGCGDNQKRCCGLFSVAGKVDIKIKSSNNEDKVNGRGGLCLRGGGGGSLEGDGRSWRRVAASGFREEEGAAHGTPASRLHAAVPATSWVRACPGFPGASRILRERMNVGHLAGS